MALNQFSPMPWYDQGGFIFSYVIDSVDQYADHLNDATRFRVTWHDATAPVPMQSGYVMAMYNELLAKMGPKEAIMIVAEAAAKELDKPHEFLSAMSYWYDSHEASKVWKPPGYTKDEIHFDYAGITTKNVFLGEQQLSNSIAFPPKPPSSLVQMDDVNILPGITELVYHPSLSIEDANPSCISYTKGTGTSARIKDMIIHLNDYHKWTRERIADWLEILDVDLTFKSPDARLVEEKQKKLSDKYKALAAQQELIPMFENKIAMAKTQIKSLESEIKQLEVEIDE